MDTAGGICWFCYWGWPRAIADIYQRAEADIDALLPTPGPDNDWTDWQGEPTCGESALEYGPAHCVWSDENFSGDFAFEFAQIESDKFAGWYPGTLAIVRRSLEELLALPDHLKEPPEGYDGENPANYPPSMEMVK